MIDVIIPAYNSHKTIEQTLFSIAYQDIVDKLNVYIVDDCSENNYNEIVRYFSNFMKIKELNVGKNSGPGVARQYGIDNSNSEYIVFIDSDDVFSDCFSLLNLYSAIKDDDYDVVVSEFVEEIGKEFFPHENDRIWLHGKIYKRSFLEEENIKFNNSRENEDNGFNQMIFLSNAKVKFIDKKTYIWRNNINSITRKNDREYGLKGLNGYIFNITYALEHAIKKGYDYDKIASLSFSALVAMYHYYLEYQDKIIDLIKKCKKIKEISNKYKIDEAKKIDIIQNQYSISINENNKKYLLNPIITIEEFFSMI